MTTASKGMNLALCLGLLSAGPAFTQTLSDKTSAEATAVAPIANVYVQTTQGVDVYNATAAGGLTLVKGSPFADTGQMEGNNGGYLISVGTNDLHTYGIGSNGAVGKQASVVNTQDYAGSDCGSTSAQGNPNGSQLDHTGEYFYVQLWAGYGVTACAAWQSYRVESNGELTFLNNLDYQTFSDGYATPSSVPTISSNDIFAYGVFSEENANPAFSTFARNSGGVWDINQKFSEIDPEANPKSTADGPWHFYPWITYDSNGLPVSFQAADPSNHMAVILASESGGYTCDGCSPEYYGAPQLASYTINSSTGAIASTNTWANMPSPSAVPNVMRMSPTGTLLALGGSKGMQIFHFNGAAPVTPYSGSLLAAVSIDQLAWDDNNHLYALSYSAEKLYVYTVTPTSITEAPGSPYKIENAYGLRGLIVVPK